jgi:hypothetical protein
MLDEGVNPEGVFCANAVLAAMINEARTVNSIFAVLNSIGVD